MNFIRVRLTVLSLLLSFAAWAGAANFFINYSNVSGLISGSIKSLAIDGRGNVWLGSKDKGASRYNGTTWTAYYNDGLSSGSIRSITVDPWGNPWFATNDGLMKFDGLNWTGISTAQGLTNKFTMTCQVQSDSSIWVGTTSGASYYHRGTWTDYTPDNSGLGDIQVFSILLEQNSSNVWFGTKSAGLRRFDGKNWTTFDKTNALKANEVRQIIQDNKGIIWVATRGGGVSRYDGSRWRTYTTDDGLPLEDIWGIATDSVGNLWCATYGNGVAKFNGKAWIAYDAADGLADNTTNAVAIDSRGRRWFGTDMGASLMTGEKPAPVQVGCDVNRDGRVNLMDVIALIILQHSNPNDSRADFNADGKVNLDDILRLSREIFNGDCPTGAALAVSGESLPESLSPADIGYVEKIIRALDLSPDQKDLLLGALQGATPVLPRAFSLEQNYPNPFNPATQIEFDVPESRAGPLSLQVFDITGRLVRTLVEGDRDPGVYRVFWDGSDQTGRPLAAGVYFYRLRADGFSSTRKMVLLK